MIPGAAARVGDAGLVFGRAGAPELGNICILVLPINPFHQRVFAVPADAPILYSFRRCPYAMRARLALAASGVRCELREVVLRDKPAELLQVSPKATVPVLVTASEVLEHSLDIMLWALRQNDPMHWLMPPTGTLDDMLALVSRCDGDFKHDLDRYKYAGRYPGADSLRHREAGSLFLGDLNHRLEADAYLFGERPALADWAVAPFVRQFAHTDIAWFDDQPWPALRRWLEAFLAEPLLARVMHKYRQWEAGAPPVFFP